MATQQVWTEPCDCGCSSESLAVEFGDHQRDPEQLLVGATAFRALLHQGHVISTDHIATEAGMDVAGVRDVLAGFVATGNAVVRDDEVVGIAGLTVEPTPHRIELAVGRRWTWCAIDAVGIVGAVGEGSIHSEADATPIELRIRDGAVEPTDAAVFLADGYGMVSAVDQWCPQVNFFASLDAADAWMARTGAPGQPIRIQEVAPQAIERWRLILAYQPTH